MARRRKEKFNYKKLASRPLPAAFHLLPPSYVLVQKLVRTKFGTPLGISITWFLFFSSFIFSFFFASWKKCFFYYRESRRRIYTFCIFRSNRKKVYRQFRCVVVYLSCSSTNRLVLDIGAADSKLRQINKHRLRKNCS